MYLRCLIVFGLVVSMSAVFAANPRLAKESSRELLTVLQSSLEGADGVIAYLPGYGIHLALHNLDADIVSDDAIKAMTKHLEEMASEVRGLDPEDWISVSFRGQGGFMTNEYEVVIRVKPLSNEYEIWMDGRQQ